MTTGQEFLKELVLESEVTRRYLERVPFDKKDFSPAEKSEKLGRLAIHVAEITAWWTSCVRDNRLDFMNFEPKNIQSTLELLTYFDELLAGAKKALSEVEDVEWEKEWSMTYGEDVLFVLPKKQVARIFCMNHLVHHRAQLGVYLRMLDIPLPAVYGPSADDENVTMIRPF
ncbi:MAG: DinB family protein [Chitinophagales bacterium]